MSDGVPIPTPWPPANNATGNYSCIILDEGSYVQRDLVDGTATEASLVVRVGGLPDTVAAVGLAEDKAVATYPAHPSEACLLLVSVGPVFGHTKLKGNSMVSARAGTEDTDVTLGTGYTGSVVVVKMLFRRQDYLQVQGPGAGTDPVIRIESNSSTAISYSPSGDSASGSVSYRVSNVSSRTAAINAVLALYPTHPDDPSLPDIGNSASFVGLRDCNARNQVWDVTIRYGVGNLNNKFGVIGKGYHGQNYTANDRHTYYQSFRDANTTLDDAISARAVGTGPNGEPLEGYDAHVERTTPTGDVIDTTVRYQWPAFQATAQTRSRSLPAQKVIVGESGLVSQLSGTLNTDQNIPGTTRESQMKFSMATIIGEEYTVLWRSNTSCKSTFAGSIGTRNTSGYTISGRTMAAGTAVLASVEEVDYGASASPQFVSEIRFDIMPFPEAWRETRVKKIEDDPDSPPANLWKYAILDPYVGLETSFPSPPTYIP